MSSPSAAASIAACTLAKGLAGDPSPPGAASSSTRSSAAAASDGIARVMHPAIAMVGAAFGLVLRFMFLHATSRGKTRQRDARPRQKWRSAGSRAALAAPVDRGAKVADDGDDVSDDGVPPAEPIPVLEEGERWMSLYGELRGLARALMRRERA